MSFWQGYRTARGKKHGAGRPSRRLAFSLAMMRWQIANKSSGRFWTWLHFRAPEWLKLAPADKVLP